jgi:tRNA/rRNA methyltransferase
VKSSSASLIEEPWFQQLRVVLVRPRNPLNIGAAARAMSNFGFMKLRLVSPWEPSFVTARSAVGATELLRNAELFTSVADAVADCSLVVGTTAVGERELQHPLHVLSQGAEKIRESLTASPAALLFGSEKTGLANDELAHCHWLMRIPTRDAHISMNLGQAVAICLYELSRAAVPLPQGSATPMAKAEELERITQLLHQALCESGFVPSGGEATALEKARRMSHRMSLDQNDAVAFTGMLRQMLWKMRHPGKTE